MRVGISTACFYPYMNTEDTIEIINKLGFKLCEVFIETEMESSIEFCSDMKSRADFYGIEIYSIHPFSVSFEPFLFDRYNRRRQEMEHKFIKICRAAEKLNAKCYVFHGLRKNPDKWDPEYTGEGMDRLCRIAKDYGVKIAWENVSWCMSSNPRFICEVKEYMKEEINFTLDIKQAVRSFEKPQEYLDIYKERITNLHISDSNEKESCLLPGEGELDLGGIMKSVSQLNDEAPCIIEVYHENYSDVKQLEDSRKYLEGLM